MIGEQVGDGRGHLARGREAHHVLTRDIAHPDQQPGVVSRPLTQDQGEEIGREQGPHLMQHLNPLAAVENGSIEQAQDAIVMREVHVSHLKKALVVIDAHPAPQPAKVSLCTPQASPITTLASDHRALPQPQFSPIRRCATLARKAKINVACDLHTYTLADTARGESIAHAGLEHGTIFTTAAARR